MLYLLFACCTYAVLYLFICSSACLAWGMYSSREIFLEVKERERGRGERKNWKKAWILVIEKRSYRGNDQRGLQRLCQAGFENSLRVNKVRLSAASVQDYTCVQGGACLASSLQPHMKQCLLTLSWYQENSYAHCTQNNRRYVIYSFRDAQCASSAAASAQHSCF